MPSFANISVTCFAASYLVAWGLELSRLGFRSGIRGALMIGFAAAGLLAHTLFLAERGLHGPQPPLSSSFDWYMITAWVLVAAYLYLTYYFPRSAIGVLLLPLVMGLVLVGNFWADKQPLASGSAVRAWGAIHGIFLMLGTVAIFVGFVAGIIYLWQSYRLKHKLSPLQRFRLPSLETLDKINTRVIFFSTAMVAGGFVSGLLLKVTRDPNRTAMSWSDPIIWSSALMLGWLVAASLFAAAYRPARQGRKVAYLTVVSFLFLLFSLGVFLVLETSHGGGEPIRDIPAEVPA